MDTAPFDVIGEMFIDVVSNVGFQWAFLLVVVYYLLIFIVSIFSLYSRGEVKAFAFLRKATGNIPTIFLLIVGAVLIVWGAF